MLATRQNHRLQAGPRRGEVKTKRPFRLGRSDNGAAPANGIHPPCRHGPQAGWPNQRASRLWFPGSSRVAANPGGVAPAVRCSPPRKSCIPGKSEHRRLHWQGPEVAKGNPWASSQSRKSVLCPYTVSATTRAGSAARRTVPVGSSVALVRVLSENRLTRGYESLACEFCRWSSLLTDTIRDQ